MKAVLLLCLLAFMTCEKDIADIGKCIYKAPKVQELISDVIVAIATKDYSKLLPKVKEALPELIKIVIGCITDEKGIEDKAKPEYKLPQTLCIPGNCPQPCYCDDKKGINHMICLQNCYLMDHAIGPLIPYINE